MHLMMSSIQQNSNHQQLYHCFTALFSLKLASTFLKFHLIAIFTENFQMLINILNENSENFELNELSSDIDVLVMSSVFVCQN